MNIIKMADLHLTEGKADDYKWNFFPWIEEQIEKYDIDRIDILGDLTEKKDQHKSSLTNKIIDRLVSLSEKCPVTILMGNHDYIDTENPFFKFLDYHKNIKFITKPTAIDGELFLPHARNPIEEWDWEDLKENLADIHTINMHQTIVGSKVPNGFSLEKGMSKDFFSDFEGDIYSGDIHMPQGIYIGAPYPVYFGDHYQGRVLLLRRKKSPKELNYPCLKKWGLKIKDPIDLEDIDFSEGDQAKITMELHPTYFPDWPAIKKEVKAYCHKEGVQLFSLEMKPEKVKVGRVRKRKATDNKKKIEAPDKILDRFIDKEGLDNRHKKVAEGIMDNDIGF